MQLCVLLMQWRTDHCVRDTAFDALCFILNKILLPPKNWAPPSYYLIKRICRVPPLWQYQWHACANDACSFPPVKPKDWGRLPERLRTCSCGLPRFKKTGNRLVPVKVSVLPSCQRRHGFSCIFKYGQKSSAWQVKEGWAEVLWLARDQGLLMAVNK